MVRIPFERALDFANKERITELLYPLFVHNIGALLYHPTNQTRTNAVMAAAQRRKQEQNQMRNTQAPGLPSLHQHHHHSMNHSIGGHLPGPQNSLTPHPGVRRPSLDRAHTFPTPPTSASSVMGYMGSSDGSFQWGPQGGMGSVQGTKSLSIDTGFSNARSMPTTPATTPPGTQIQSMQQYQQGSLPHGASLQSYSTPRPLYEGCDSFQQIHGMDDVRQIVLNHLLANQSPRDPTDPSAGEPRHKTARLDYAPLESSRDTKQPLDASVFKAKFNVLLEAEEFLKQQFKESNGCSLGSVITLTGTARYAQASTVRDYLGQNWPSTGPRLLKLIEELIAAGWDTSKGFSQGKSPFRF
jgi:hypothetical protein